MGHADILKWKVIVVSICTGKEGSRKKNTASPRGTEGNDKH